MKIGTASIYNIYICRMSVAEGNVSTIDIPMGTVFTLEEIEKVR
jgi:hypothetical protein